MTYPLMVIPEPLEVMLRRMELNYRRARHDAPENVRCACRERSAVASKRKTVFLFVRRQPKLVHRHDKMLAAALHRAGVKVCVRSYEQTKAKHDPFERAWFDELEKL